MKFKKIISVISAAVIAASAASVSAVPVSAADNTDGWKTSYSKFMKNKFKGMDFSSVSPEAFGFSVIDLDGNGVPELIESGHQMHPATCIIYTRAEKCSVWERPKAAITVLSIMTL